MPLSEVVGDEEIVARFIVSSGEFSSAKEVAKPKLFRDTRRTGLSVCRESYCTFERMKDVGWTQVAQKHKQPKILYGWASLPVRGLRGSDIDLDVIPDPLPNYVEHALIVGIPENPELQDRLLLEQSLVSLAGELTLL